MNKVVDWLKSIRLDRIFTVFLVGILMFVSTACSGGASAKTADQIREEVPGSAVTNEYKGGMNDYSDVDPRRNTTEAQAKAKGLVDNARKNIEEKSVDSGEQYVENYRSGTPLGERVKRIGENVGKAAENVTEDISKGTKENAQNAQKAAKGATQAADETANAAQSKVKSDIKTTQRSAEDTAEAVKSKVSRDVNRTQRALDDAADAID